LRSDVDVHGVRGVPIERCKVAAFSQQVAVVADASAVSVAVAAAAVLMMLLPLLQPLLAVVCDDAAYVAVAAADADAVVADTADVVAASDVADVASSADAYAVVIP